MSKKRNWFDTWTARIVLTIVAVLALIVGLPVYLTITAEPLHAQPQDAPSVAQPEPSPQWSESVARARAILRESLAEQNLPGLSVAVGVGADIVWAEGFGWADLKARAPVTPDTRFRIGTASTLLTTAAVGVLLEQGRLQLDDEIQVYVPQFPQKQWPVTLRQVMGHAGGVGTDDAEDDPLSRQHCERPAEAVPQFADAPLLFEPGTQHRPSNYGWILVSAAVEAAAGQPFLTFMREQVFRPVGMNNTGAESATKENPEDVGGPGEDPPPFTLIRELILEPLGVGSAKAFPKEDPATFYAPGRGPHPDFRHGLHVQHPRNLSCYAGAKAFFSTPSDLVRFGLATNGGTLLQPATAQLLQTPQPLIGELMGTKVATLTRLGDSGMVVAVMSNASTADTSALAAQVAAAFAER
jgi:serine beta-lactamase-like protein LACTB, mitochondrial